MKRNFNIIDGLVLLALFFKLNHSGPALSWLAVFTPYLVEVIYLIAAALLEPLQWGSRFKFWVWQKATAWRVSNASRKATKFVTKKYNSGNPGRVVDNEKEGLQ